MTTTITWQQELEIFRKALAVVRNNCALTEYSRIERSGTILNFQIALNHAWRTMQAYVAAQGLLARDRRDALAQAHKLQLIGERRPWVRLLRSDELFGERIVDEPVALEALGELKESFFPVLEAFETAIGCQQGKEGKP
jgi:hypothetical protein